MFCGLLVNRDWEMRMFETPMGQATLRLEETYKNEGIFPQRAMVARSW